MLDRERAGDRCDCDACAEVLAVPEEDEPDENGRDVVSALPARRWNANREVGPRIPGRARAG